MFTRYWSAAGLPPIRLHDTRHTAATRMLDSGTTVSPRCAGWLDHDPAMTLGLRPCLRRRARGGQRATGRHMPDTAFHRHEAAPRRTHSQAVRVRYRYRTSVLATARAHPAIPGLRPQSLPCAKSVGTLWHKRGFRDKHRHSRSTLWTAEILVGADGIEPPTAGV